jgi:penicillin V acylase-like amidase (Ntn superfamily)
MLTLVNTKYEEPSPIHQNIFAGSFCHFVSQSYAQAEDVLEDINRIRIYGPEALAMHFLIRDANGISVIIEVRSFHYVCDLDV